MKLLASVLLLWLVSVASVAEPLHPLRSKTSLNSLRRQLWQTPPGLARATLLLQLSHSLVDNHEELGTPLDSAYAYGRQARALSQHLGATAASISSQYVLGRLAPYLPHPADGKPLLQQAIAESRKLGRQRLEADGWYYLGKLYPTSAADMPQRIQCFQRAMGLYQALGYTRQQAYMLKTIADMHLVQGNDALARQELLRVVALYRAAGHRQLQYTYDLLRETSRKAGNYEEALRYGLAALESAQATQDTATLAYFNTRVGTLYQNLNQLDESLTYFKQALALAHKANNAFDVLDIAGGIAHVLITQRRPQQALAFFRRELQAYPATDAPTQFSANMALASCYTATRQFALAEKYEARLLHLIGDNQAYAHNYGQQLAVYYRLGQLQVMSQRYEKGRAFLHKAQALQARIGNPSIGARIELLLFKADSAEAKYQAAIGHYQRYKSLNDSIFNETKSKQLASLQVQYDTHKKEQNIALLTRQAQAQQARLRQREFQRNAVVGGALLLTLILGLVYNRYRLKQRSNQLLEAKQDEINAQNQALQHLVTEKEWMLKEIHHRVKNNLEVISSLLETQSDYLRDPAAIIALREGQNRVHAMALIHQKLYQKERLSVVRMPDYIHDITEYLLESFNCQHTVQLRLDVAPVALDVTLATPLGLILNEALTNSLKYAFPPPRTGTITIELLETKPGHLQLTMADNGVGFPPGVSLDENPSMGLTIIRGLGGQLDGELSIVSGGPGVCIQLVFEAATSPARSAPMAIG